MGGLTSDNPVIVEDAGPRRGSRADPDAKTRWWNADKSKLHDQVFAYVRALETRQTGRRAELQRFRRLYDRKGPVGRMGAGGPDLATAIQTASRNSRLTLNVVRSCISTVGAKIAKNKPRPLFLTSGAPWGMQRKGKQLTRFMHGIFNASGIYDEGPRVFRDGCIYDGGLLRVYSDENAKSLSKMLRCERVMVDEIFVDEVEAYYGCPRQMHHRRIMSRDRLGELFPGAENQQKISAAEAVRGLPGMTAGDSNMVVVIESWHLPSTPDAKDGLRTICVDTVCLLHEPYTMTRFPFARFVWDEALTGYWGDGLVSELEAIQREIDRLMRDIREGQRMMCVARYLIEENSNVTVSHLTNGIATIVKYRGQPPQVQTPQGVSPELYQQLERLYSKAYEITGVSQMAAQSKKEPGIDSGVAIREMNDIGSERFALVGQRYEAFYMDAARLFIDFARELAAAGKIPTVNAKAGRSLESIKWSDVDMDDDEFEMRIWPISQLPQTPSGRLQFITDLVQGGFVESKPLAMSLLDYPDLEEFISVQTAGMENAQMIVEHLSEGGDYINPEAPMDLQNCLSAAHTAWLRGMIKKSLPRGALENLRRFMDDCQTLLAPPPPEPAALSAGPPGPGGPGTPMPMPGGGAVAPVGVPAPSPVNDLLPLAAGAPAAA